MHHLVLNGHSQSCKVTELIDGPFISLELSPNRNLNLNELRTLSTNFFSVSWIRGTSLDATISLAQRLRVDNGQVLLHLPGRNLTKLEALHVLMMARKIGVKSILALQGDSADKGLLCDFPYASHLVDFIRSHFGNYFCIAVAAYPDTHPQSESEHTDLFYLREKIRCGADFIITQASFSYDTLDDFSNNCRKYDINVPIIPGLFLINSYKSLMGMMKFCAVSVPNDIMQTVIANMNNDAALKEYGLNLATNLIGKILRCNNNLLVKGVHIFSLNNLQLTKELMKRLGFIVEIERPLYLDFNQNTKILTI